MRHTAVLAATIAAILAGAPGIAAAQAGTSAGPGSGPAASQPNQSEANSQTSNMGPAIGNRGDANNGIGTQGSLDHDAGKASSTVTGMKGGTAALGGQSSQGTGKMESDPTQGGSQPK